MAKKTIITRIGGHQFVTEVDVPDDGQPIVPEVTEERPKPKRRARKKAENPTIEAVPSSTPDENTPA